MLPLRPLLKLVPAQLRTGMGKWVRIELPTSELSDPALRH